MRLATILIVPVFAALVGCGDNPPGERIELDFSALPDGPLPTEFDGGEPTFSSPPLSADTTLRVAGGKLTFAPVAAEVAAGYLSTGDLGQAITNIGAEWTFTPKPGGTPGAMALAVTRKLIDAPTGQGPPMPLHYVVDRDGWGIGVWTDDNLVEGELAVIAAGRFAQPLVEDGTTRYRTEVWLDGDTATIELPDGRETRVSDPRISAFASNYAFFECFSNVGSTDSVAGFTRVWAEAGHP